MANNNDKQTLVLLDMNAILHRGYHALPDFSSSSGMPTGALYGLSMMLISIINELEPDHIAACYDLAEPTHRHKKFSDYKAHRPKTDEELITQIEESRKILDAFKIDWFAQEGFEADDLLGTIVEQCKDKDDLEIIISSGDHDTLQLVDGTRVKVFTMRRGIKDTVLYDEAGVVEKFGFASDLLPDYKGLRGDSSDNIPGISGVGEVTATKFISTFGTLEEIYEAIEEDEEAAAKKADLTSRFVTLVKNGKDEAMFSKELATIRRDAPIEFKLNGDIWRDRVDYEEVKEVFDTYGFRSLVPRLKDILNENEKAADDSGADTEGENIDENEKDNHEEALADVPDEKIKELKIALWLVDSSYTDPDTEDIFEYTETNDFSKAKEQLLSEIEDNDLTYVYEQIELPLVPVIAKMQNRGIKLDCDYLEELRESYQAEVDEIESRIHEIVGEEFNVNSPQQLSEALFETLGLPHSNLKTTKSGNVSTAQDQLEKIAGEHEVIDLVLEYREIKKLLGTYIEPLPQMVDDEDRLHTTFVQTGTTTGRLSSRDPNLQNIPVRTKRGRVIRNAFIPADGHTLVALDYSQIELRIAAVLSEDENLLEVFKSGEDIHAQVAARIFDVPAGEVTKRQRSAAKTINYGILYGMGVDALRKNLDQDKADDEPGTTRSEAREYLDQYFESFPGLEEFMDEMKQKVKEDGYTETYFGRRRQFPEIYSSRSYVRAQAERMAINAPIQGTQADVIKRAMVEVDEYLEEEDITGAHLLLQVHDELVFEIKDELVGELVPRIKEIMEGIMSGEETKGITFVADAQVGENWGELKDFS